MISESAISRRILMALVISAPLPMLPLVLFVYPVEALAESKRWSLTILLSQGGL